MPNQNKLTRPKPPRQLYFGKQFEFTSALPVKECAARLQQADRMATGCYLNPPVFVNVDSESDEDFRFNMYVESRVGKGWVSGTLQPMDNLNTHVSGRFGAGPEIVVVGVVLIMLTPIIMFASLTPHDTGTIVGLSEVLIVLFLIVFWTNLQWARSKLFKVFEQIVKV